MRTRSKRMTNCNGSYRLIFSALVSRTCASPSSAAPLMTCMLDHHRWMSTALRMISAMRKSASPFPWTALASAAFTVPRAPRYAAYAWERPLHDAMSGMHPATLTADVSPKQLAPKRSTAALRVARAASTPSERRRWRYPRCRFATDPRPFG
jgi:hypothetical protein